VLNVGGYSKSIGMPPHYQEWEQLLLDIDPRSGADLICDARHLDERAPAEFDAVYCAHNLEHYYFHEVPKVLAGFHRILKPNGFVEIRVPDIEALMEHLVRHRMALEDVLYTSPVGPITALDVIYGYNKEIEESGKDFWAHKTGFSPKRLQASLIRAGFPNVYLTMIKEKVEVRAFGFKMIPLSDDARILGLSSPSHA
jgi:SAM-dependent methyltransferase